MTAAQTNRPTLLSDHLDWILEILRGRDEDVAVTVGQLPVGHVEVDRFTVYPSLRQPRLLISGGSNRVRSAVLERVADRSSSWSSVAKKMSAHAARLGADQLALGPDLIVSRPADVGSTAGAAQHMTLREHLEQAIHADDVCLGITVGPLRPNRKPVIQLMDHSGQLIAYAKVGWDPSTIAMVRHEASVLEAMPRIPNLVTPKVLHHGDWKSMSVLVTAPVDHAGPSTPTQAMIVDALAEITRITPRSTTTLATSTWASRQRDRIARLGERGNDLSELLERCIELHGDTELVFGTAHGDWAPWNMRRVGHRLGVWDWERSRNDAPVGIDLVHFHFQRGFHAADQSVADGVDAIRRHVPTQLTALGIDGDLHDLIAVLYLVELTLRFAESANASDHGLARVQDDLVVELHHLVPRIGATTEDRRNDRHPESPTRGKLFTRRMLGGSGVVPAPVRSTIKRTAKSYGRSTSSMRVLPNTYIVGGQRCGTTSMFRYLTQNASVTGPMLEKGVHYFDTNYHQDADWYRSHFPTRRTVRLAKQRNGVDLRVLEASPYYLFHPMIPERIHRLTPDAKIVVLVREPADRALSHHNHEVKRGFESLSFADAIAAEDERMAGEIERMAADPTYVSYAHQHHSYVGRGRYAEQIQRYDDLFGRDNVKIVRTQDLETEPASVVDDVLMFLGVPVMGKISFPHYNARSYSSMDADVQAQLRDRFAESDAWLADRLGVDDLWD